MKRSVATLTRYLFLASILVTSVASAQNDIEDPNSFEGIWYRLALDDDGTYVLGDGDGYAGGTWYYYPQADGSGWWRHWFYNGPYDPSRKGRLEYAVYIKAFDASRRTAAEVRFNWTTPQWAAQNKQRPPLPSDIATEDMESKYMQSHDLQYVDHWFIGTIEPIKSHTISDYNPQWISIDIRGHNAYIYRGANHYSLPKDPAVGACYDEATGDCYAGYQYQCRAPYVWLGAGSWCADLVPAGPFPVPVYQFWSPTGLKHFYTASEREKDSLLTESEEICAFEGVAFYALMDDTDPNSRPVYRIWSETMGGYLYTMIEDEKADLQIQQGHVATYEGPVFYAFPEGIQPSGTVPVYCFRSTDSDHRLYTIDEAEKDELLNNHRADWAYEGIAWYAYEP